jgi:hypothetical protein
MSDDKKQVAYHKGHLVKVIVEGNVDGKEKSVIEYKSGLTSEVNSSELIKPKSDS